MIRKGLGVFLAVVGAMALTVGSAMGDTKNWADASRAQRLTVTVDPGQVARQDYPAEFKIQNVAGFKGLRVMEADKDLPFQYDEKSGEMVVLLPGVTDKPRNVEVYFGSEKSAEVAPMIKRTDTEFYGYSAWQFTFPASKWTFEQFGGCWGQAFDRDGGDWINYIAEGTPGALNGAWYVGMPNLQTCIRRNNRVRYDGVFHCGNKKEDGYDGKSEILVDGPIKQTIRSTVIVAEMNPNVVVNLANGEKGKEARPHDAAGTWVATWDIYPSYMRCVVSQGNDAGFAFLYEGIPGGEKELATSKTDRPDWVATSLRPEKVREDFRWDKGVDWAIVGDDRHPRTMWYAHTTAVADVGGRRVDMPGNHLIVLGFGRDVQGTALNTYPQTFYCGFAETTEVADTVKVIDSATKPVTVTVGAVEKK